MDFRVLPYSKYFEYDNHSLTNKNKFKIRDYYILIYLLRRLGSLHLPF